MREDDIIAQIITEVRAATPDGVDVRTDGGDGNIEPPEVIVSFSNTRLSDENGHKAFAKVIRNDSGDATGREHHMYFRAEVELFIRYYSEVTRDQVIADIHSAFLPYESDSSSFNTDTTEWEVGGGNRSHNSFVEQDWYEGSAILSFKYVKRAEDTGGDVIETINVTVEPDESLEETTSETKIN